MSSEPVTQNDLIKWYKRRGRPADRISMLLEFYLIIHFDPETGETKTSRKDIADYASWTFKSVAKAVNQLDSEGNWTVIEGNERKIVFRPNL